MKLKPIIAFIFVIIAVIIALFFSKKCTGSENKTNTADSQKTISALPASEKVNPTASALEAQPVDPGEVQPTSVDVLKFTTPEELLGAISEALEKGDKSLLSKVFPGNLTEEQLAQLTAFASQSKLNRPSHIIEIGELERKDAVRYALEFQDKQRLLLDLRTKANEKNWKVSDIKLLLNDKELTEGITQNKGITQNGDNDSLGVCASFLEACLALDFEKCRSFVDSKKVSDAKIIGLCILFEEGGYKLAKQQPVLAMFKREKAAGYIANLTRPKDGENVNPVALTKAQFGLTTSQSPEGKWLISDVALNKLLSDYAERFYEGDIHYSPIISNPEGGDTVVIYFEFDAGQLTPRTTRQLAIVSSLLKLDPNRKIKLTGHTDTLGSESYNSQLSGNRAKIVKAYLIEQGVAPNQIEIAAAGESSPRRPEVTATGDDDPFGRRANRRTEIYLDF